MYSKKSDYTQVLKYTMRRKNDVVKKKTLSLVSKEWNVVVNSTLFLQLTHTPKHILWEVRSIWKTKSATFWTKSATFCYFRTTFIWYFFGFSRVLFRDLYSYLRGESMWLAVTACQVCVVLISQISHIILIFCALISKEHYRMLVNFTPRYFV